MNQYLVFLGYNTIVAKFNNYRDALAYLLAIPAQDQTSFKYSVVLREPNGDQHVIA